MKNLWKKWKTLTKKIVSVQANIVLTIIYFVIFVPLGVFLQIFSKKTLLGHRYKVRHNTNWIKRKKVIYDLPFARQQ